jgi:hypothetical protein
MKTIGIVLLVIGSLAFLIGFNMDTSVDTGFGGRINNIGLMNDRQNIIILAGVLTVIGAIFAALASKNKLNSPEISSVENENTRKCPYCAELVKVEAIVCKHCRADLPEFKPESPELDKQPKVYLPSEEADQKKAMMLLSLHKSGFPLSSSEVDFLKKRGTTI